MCSSDLNNVRRTLRRERGRAEVLVEEPEGASEAHEPGFFSAENLAFLRYALIGMPRTQQVAYVLREGLGLTWQTIGFVLERREAAAARLVHYRAAHRVRALAGTRPDLRLVTTAV